jgi:ubiquinone/menaquinone biosynthesis C-methylase UbiE
MSSQQEMVQFFDERAAEWDSRQSEETRIKIDQIISRIPINKETRILDVACGTGILTERLLLAGFSSIAAIDISPKMMEIFSQKYPDIEAYTASFEACFFDGAKYDLVFLFNGFPHFSSPEKFFSHSCEILSPGGQLCIAHSMTREQLNEHHRKAGKVVEKDVLISDQEFHALYRAAGFSQIVVDSSDCFFSLGKRV